MTGAPGHRVDAPKNGTFGTCVSSTFGVDSPTLTAPPLRRGNESRRTANWGARIASGAFWPGLSGSGLRSALDHGRMGQAVDALQLKDHPRLVVGLVGFFEPVVRIRDLAKPI